MKRAFHVNVYLQHGQHARNPRWYTVGSYDTWDQAITAASYHRYHNCGQPQRVQVTHMSLVQWDSEAFGGE